MSLFQEIGYLVEIMNNYDYLEPFDDFIFVDEEYLAWSEVLSTEGSALKIYDPGLLATVSLFTDSGMCLILCSSG